MSSCTQAEDVLTHGFGFVRAMGFNGSFVVEISSWDAWDALGAICSTCMCSIFWSWAIWPPLPLFALDERHTVWSSVWSVKQVDELSVNTRKKKCTSLVRSPWLFASFRTCCLWEHILRLSQPFLYIICSHLRGIVRGKFESPRAHLIVRLPYIAHCMPKLRVPLMWTLIHKNSTECTYGM